MIVSWNTSAKLSSIGFQQIDSMADGGADRILLRYK
jgi:hypothetical protein